MKCLFILLILAPLLLGVVSAGNQMSKEVTGKSCGKYMVLNSNNQEYETVNMVWYNLDWDCRCNKVSTRIPIWLIKDGSMIMGYTCQKIA